MEVEWAPAATRDLRKLRQPTVQRVRQAVVTFAETGRGDLSKLRGRESEWRLRVGDWRVLLTFPEWGNTLRVERVLHRREAYR